MSKFTPGKWIYYPPSENDMREGLEDCTILSTQGIIGHFIGTISTEADARLIVAAPELYKMLREELIPSSDYGGMLSLSREGKVRALLARIDGEEAPE